MIDIHTHLLPCPDIGVKITDYMEGFPSRKAKALQAAQAHFEPLERMFNQLPQTREPMKFAEGQAVQFPPHEGSNTSVEWKIVRAEKKHYLLERQNENGTFDHLFCSEAELLDYASKKERE